MSKKPLKSGLYYAYAPDYKPQMIDPKYDGFRIVYMGERQITSNRPAGMEVMTDNCEVKSMADGKTYTSKKQLYDSYKAHDVRVLEPGEYNPDKPHRDRLSKADLNCRAELKAAIQQHLGS